MKIKLGNKKYNLVYKKLKKCDGFCSHPDYPNRTITVDNTLKDPRLLEVIIHECLHGLLWVLDEETVENGSTDIAKVLWKLGYRKIK